MSRAAERLNARLAAVQGLYQMEIAGAGLADVLAEFGSHWIGREVEGDSYGPAEFGHFRAVLEGTVERQRDIDARIDSILTDGWPLRRVEAVLRAVLRAAAFEIGWRKDVPVRVAIKEYVDVAAGFLGPEEVGMANAVLDRFARLARPQDFDAAETQRKAP